MEQLRPVLAELHAVTIRETVSFHLAHRQFGPDGAWHGSSEQDGAVEATGRLLRQLAWWARALRTARDAHTYPMD